MIQFTGERVVPGQVNDDLWAEHFCRYAFASQFVQGHHVLDIGSGAGYGTAELAKTARQAVGLEVSLEATRFATESYGAANLHYVTGSATQLPYHDQAFDLVTAFEIIEHIPHWQDLLMESRRVLHTQGTFLVSTPNKLYYTESRGETGPNPYHVHEFEYAEFKQTLEQLFPYVNIFVQNHVSGFAIYQDTFGETTAALANKKYEPTEAHFFLAVCSQEPLPTLKDFVYIPRTANLLREREHHILSLQRQLAEEREQRNQHVAALEQQLSDERAARQRHIQSLQTELSGVTNDYKNLEHDRDEKRAWAERLHNEIEIARRAISTAEATVIERTNWAKRLDASLNQLEASRWTRLGRKLRFLPPLDHGSDNKDA